jgi:methylase of polypeptide subunit release factors
MESQQMMEFLLKMEADRKADQEKAEADRKANKEEIKTGNKELLAKMDAHKAKQTLTESKWKNS